MFYHCFYLHSLLLHFTTIYHELSAFIIFLCYCTYKTTRVTGYYLKLDLLNSGFSVPDSFSSKYFRSECD